jgi:cysteine desulfurase
MTTLGVDLLTISGHKCGGPHGAAALVARTDPAALLVGGGQERGRRAGTENVAAIAGFGVAAELAGAELAEAPSIARLRDALEVAVRAASNNAVVIGAGQARLPNTSCLALPGFKAETQVMALDLAGVAVSAGSACSSGKMTRSAVLTAMGVAPSHSETAIRISCGWNTVSEDIDRLIAAWLDLYIRVAQSDISRARAA